MRSDQTTVHRIVFFVVAVALGVTAVVIGRRYLLRAWARRVEDRAMHAWLQERNREFAFVRQKLQDFKELDEPERAKAVWQLWCYVSDREWKGDPKDTGERWTSGSAIKRELLQPELEGLGDSGFDVLVKEIRDPSGNTRFFRSLHADEASKCLSVFGERAVYALIEILEIEDPELQLLALKGLWSCVSVLELTDEAQRAIVEAVTPFLHNADESLRRKARIVLEDLRD